MSVFPKINFKGAELSLKINPRSGKSTVADYNTFKYKKEQDSTVSTQKPSDHRKTSLCRALHKMKTLCRSCNKKINILLTDLNIM